MTNKNFTIIVEKSTSPEMKLFMEHFLTSGGRNCANCDGKNICPIGSSMDSLIGPLIAIHVHTLDKVLLDFNLPNPRVVSLFIRDHKAKTTWIYEGKRSLEEMTALVVNVFSLYTEGDLNLFDPKTETISDKRAVSPEVS